MWSNEPDPCVYFRKHDKVFEKSKTEELGVIDASAKLIVPEQGLFSDSPLSRLAAKLSIGSHVANLIGTVDVTTTETIQYSEDLYKYEFEVYKDGDLINDSYIHYSSGINYTSKSVINSKVSVSGAKWFWE